MNCNFHSKEVPEETWTAWNSVFDRLDTDHDGVMSAAELRLLSLQGPAFFPFSGEVDIKFLKFGAASSLENRTAFGQASPILAGGPESQVLWFSSVLSGRRCFSPSEFVISSSSPRKSMGMVAFLEEPR